MDDSCKIKIEEYSGNIKKYFCGNTFLIIDENPRDKLLICLLDANECIIGYCDGISFNPIWKKESFVPRKQDAGGQSEKRFERNRELALLDWFKTINKKLLEICMNDKRNIKYLLVGINKCNEFVFFKNMHDYVLRRFLTQDSTGYVSDNGAFELIDKCEDKIKEFKISEERNLVDNFAKLLNKNSPLVDYSISGLNEQKNELILYSNKINEDELAAINRISCNKIKLCGFHIIDALRVCIINKY